LTLSSIFPGGKNACLPANKAPASVDAGKDCIIYSVGSNGQFDFEQAIYERFRCEVHTFDCTVTPETVPSFVRYHPICLGAPAADPASAKYLGWKQLVERLGHLGRKPLLVKMDIEGWEYPFFHEYFSDQSIPRISQLLIEMHDRRSPNDIDGGPRYAKTDPKVLGIADNKGEHLRATLNAFVDLDNDGFDMAAKEHNIHRNGGIYCYQCSEFTFVRRDYDWSAWVPS